jgi:hypothetical protein
MMHLGRLAHTVQHNARLDDSALPLRIERDEAVHVLRKIQHDRDIAALTGEARSRAARQNRRAQFAAGGDGRFHVGGIARHHHANRRLPVIRRIRCVEGTRGRIEAHLAANRSRQQRLQLPRRSELLMRMRSSWPHSYCENALLAHHSFLRR